MSYTFSCGSPYLDVYKNGEKISNHDTVPFEKGDVFEIEDNGGGFTPKGIMVITTNKQQQDYSLDGVDPMDIEVVDSDIDVMYNRGVGPNIGGSFIIRTGSATPPVYDALKIGDKIVKDINGKKLKSLTINGTTYEFKTDEPTPTTKTLSGIWHFKKAFPDFQDFDVNINFSSRLNPTNMYSTSLDVMKAYTSIHVSANGLGEMRYDDDYVCDGDMSALTNIYAYLDFGSLPQEVSEEFYNWFTSQAEPFEVAEDFSNIMGTIPAGDYNFGDTLEFMPTYEEMPCIEYLDEDDPDNFNWHIVADNNIVTKIIIDQDFIGAEVNGEGVLWWVQGEWINKPDMIGIPEDVIVPIEFAEWFITNLVEHSSGGAN